MKTLVKIQIKSVTDSLLRGADLEGADLEGADLYGLNMEK